MDIQKNKTNLFHKITVVKKNCFQFHRRQIIVANIDITHEHEQHFFYTKQLQIICARERATCIFYI